MFYLKLVSSTFIHDDGGLFITIHCKAKKIYYRKLFCISVKYVHLNVKTFTINGGRGKENKVKVGE